MPIARRGLLAGAVALGASAVLPFAPPASADVALPLIGPVTGNGIGVMSFNLRTATDTGDRAWVNRLSRVRRLIRQEHPTILGTQEGRLHQIRDLKAELPGYGCVFHGRDADGTGETTAILFDKSRVKKVDSGHLWLSDTPHRAGSITWGNKFPRTMTWVMFDDKRTGKRFVHVNTHFDHVSASSRRRSADMVRNRMKKFKLPTVLTGDFNTTPGGVPHATLVKGAFHDAWNHPTKRVTPAYSTTNGWNPTPKRTGHRIDWIIVSGGITVRKVGVNTWVPNSRLTPSDHWAMQAVVAIG